MNLKYTILVLLFSTFTLFSCRERIVVNTPQELAEYFDFDDSTSVKAKNLLDSLSIKDSLTVEDLNLMDSLTTYLKQDSTFEAKDEAEAIEGQYLRRLVIHCTASNINTPYTKESLLSFFKNSQHWSKPGYTFFIDRKGIIWKLNQYWDWDPIVNYNELTFGAKGYNSTSLHISWDGGIENNKVVDNRTPEQKIALKSFVIITKDIYPNIDVLGHRDLPGVKKLCPIFNIKEEYKDILNK